MGKINKQRIMEKMRKAVKYLKNFSLQNPRLSHTPPPKLNNIDEEKSPESIATARNKDEVRNYELQYSYRNNKPDDVKSPVTTLYYGGRNLMHKKRRNTIQQKKLIKKIHNPFFENHYGDVLSEALEELALSPLTK